MLNKCSLPLLKFNLFIIWSQYNRATAYNTSFLETVLSLNTYCTTWCYQYKLVQLITVRTRESLGIYFTLLYRKNVVYILRGGTKGHRNIVGHLTCTRLISVVRMAQRSILWSADSCHNIGRYWMSAPAYGRMDASIRSIRNEITWRTCIWLPR